MMTEKHKLCTELSTISGGNVHNFVDKGVFLCLREYIQNRNDMQKRLFRSLPYMRIFGWLGVILFTLAATLGIPVCIAVSEESGAVVVIDAGHGGADGGVTGVNSGVKESDLNLVMARLVGEYLESGGFEVVFTRKGKGGLYRDTDRDKKRTDMLRRGELIRRVSPAAVVSIHMNTFSSSSRRGAQVFFDASSEGGRALAEVMQDRLNRDFNLSGAGRAFAPLSAEKYILSCSAAPTVIVECGFLSNPSDEKDLLSSDYRARFSYSVFRALAQFLSDGA